MNGVIIGLGILLFSVTIAVAQDAQGDAGEFTLTDLRLQTTKGFEFFSVRGETTLATLGPAIMRLLPQMEAAMTEAGARPAGAVVFIYRGATGDPNAPFTLEVGRVVEPGAGAAGEASVIKTDDFACASAAYVGPQNQMGAAAGEVRRRFAEAGYGAPAEYREVYLQWEGDDSPNNVVLLQVGVGPSVKAPPAGRAEPSMAVSPMRVRTVEGFDYLYAEGEARRGSMPQVFGELYPKYADQRRAAGIAPEAERAIYIGAMTTDKPFRLQVGQKVPKGTQPGGDARVRTVHPLYCVTSIYTGGIPTLGEAVGRLFAEARAAGLTTTDEYREYYLYWEGFDSPNNVMMLMAGIDEHDAD